MDTSMESDEYYEGYRSTLKGKSRDANPYVEGTELESDWDEGWVQGNKEN